MARFKNAADIINQVALEVGLRKVSDPFAEQDSAYQQLVGLLNTSGTELIQEAEWGILRREVSFTTQAVDTGIYDLPADFSYMIDQTGWERAQNVPLFGPLSAQMWSYLLGRDLVSYTIYASFRLTEGKFYLFPQPPAEGLEIAYEYVSTNWVIDSSQPSDPPTYADNVKAAGDTILFNPYLTERLLKNKFLEARGFDTTKSEDDYNLALSSWKGKDKGAPVLNAGRGGWVYPYLDPYRNTPDTNFGNP
jgi:hypothetical protein